MFRLIKQCFFTGFLTSVNSLSCIPTNNQECQVKPHIVNFNGDDSVFFPYHIKASKYSGSCNNINDPLSKLCVPDVVKNLKVKVFDLVSGTNETRRIEWHETYKCKCRINSNVCNNKKHWNDYKCRYECKELIDKCVCDKGFIWNPRNCECECYKSCDFSEYLDYKNCECKKRLVNKLVEECTENIYETRLVETNSTECKHNSCTLYIVLFSVFSVLKERCYLC